MTKERLKRGAVCAGLAVVAAVLLAGRVVEVKTAAQLSNRPVEETGKNIQVLKGLPESQLTPLMNFIAVSLGVQCDFCHVKQGKDPKTGFDNWVWESDEKSEKRTAREMMRMVLALNKDADAYGIARGQVTCFTCHRGQERPTNQPTLPLTKSGHEPAPNATPAASTTPAPTPTRAPSPTVQQVFDKYVAAVGGREAVAKLQAWTVKGTREASQGRVWPFEATLKGADKFLMVVQVPQFGTVTQGANGASGWTRSPRGQRALTPAELTELKHAAELLDVIKVKPAATMRVIGRRKLGERDAFVVVDRPRDGVSQRFFFDAQTGLLLRITTTTDTLLNPLPEQIDFEGYRDVGGVKIPFIVRVSKIDTWDSYTRVISEVVPNALVSDSKFDQPPAPAQTPKP